MPDACLLGTQLKPEVQSGTVPTSRLDDIFQREKHHPFCRARALAGDDHAHEPDERSLWLFPDPPRIWYALGLEEWPQGLEWMAAWTVVGRAIIPGDHVAWRQRRKRRGRVP